MGKHLYSAIHIGFASGSRPIVRDWKLRQKRESRHCPNPAANKSLSSLSLCERVAFKNSPTRYIPYTTGLPAYIRSWKADHKSTNFSVRAGF
ncbi:hypothetical protein CDAR_32341 [Caerostris darwini]|uniref:Uncharacterized protein n=1 Tax=Caerostris darwini TaxID=1538125 RepID=A0AAV4WPY5_9ARAC|nr:hypothetical protein CDAR_32341 [Caerostris darwini]